jgi:inhibitor of cysteine peptidase
MRFFIAAVVFVLALGCSGRREAETVLRLTADDAGKERHITVDGELTIALPSNPTTGYAWELEACDTAILDNPSHEFVAPNTTMEGSGGTEEWHFAGKSTGQTEVRLVYRRSWEKAEPLETYSVTIVVDPPKRPKRAPKTPKPSQAEGV